MYTEYDEASHEILTTGFAAQIRRDSGIKDLVIYRHRETCRFVLAILSDDGRAMYEIGYADGQQGEKDHPPSRAVRQEMIKRLRTGWKTGADIIKERLDTYKNWLAEQEEAQATFDDGVQGMYRYLRKNKGAHAAEEYAQSAGLNVREIGKGHDVFVAT